MRIPYLWSTLILLGAAIVLPGCGGGGASNSQISSTNTTGQTVRVTMSIIWGARSRVVNSPNSALSGKLTLQGAKPGGGDFTFPFDRADPTLASYTQTYTTPTPALVGTWPATVTFYANKGSQGSVVGTARKQVTLTVSSANIGDIATTGTVASITAPDPQTFEIGQPADLMFTALDADGHVVAVTPGSALWTINPGSNYSGGQVDASGHVPTQFPADLTAMVAMDGKASPLIHIHIVPSIKYTVTQIGALPGDTYSIPYGLNARGDAVVGFSTRSSSDPYNHAFLWTSAGGLQSLGKLQGDTDSIGYGVNASDQVVGVSSPPQVYASKFYWRPDADEAHAFLWTPGTGIQGLPMTAAYGINDAGQVVGQANRHAALWTSVGGVTDLGVMPGYSISAAIAINNAGQVLCIAYTENGLQGGSFLWTQTGGIQPIPGYATALSSNGTVVGVTASLPNSSWFTWTPGGNLTGIPIGYPANAKAGNSILPPTGISATGQIVTTVTGDFGLVITNGLWLALDNLTGVHVYGVQGINDNDQIIAQNEDKAILLTPK